MDIKSRYEIGKNYIIHNMYRSKAKAIKYLFIDKLVVTGFEIYDNNHGFTQENDGLYYFSNDATIELDIKENRNELINTLLK